MKNDVLIDVRHLRKEYPVEDDPVVALDDVNLQIRRGEICCIFGPSGSGKSTLLNQLAGLEKPTSGAVKIGDTIISALSESQLAEFRQKKLGFVFQSYNLLPSLNALENVSLPLMFQGVPKAVREKRAAAMLKKVGLANRMMHYPRQMSGGQQQRVAAARALVTDPAIILADEPTGALDSKNARLLLESIETMNRQYQATVLMVTHDSFAASYTNRVLFIRDGRIFTELRRGDSPRREFFDRIMEVVAMMGGEGSDAL